MNKKAGVNRGSMQWFSYINTVHTIPGVEIYG